MRNVKGIQFKFIRFFKNPRSILYKNIPRLICSNPGAVLKLHFYRIFFVSSGKARPRQKVTQGPTTNSLRSNSGNNINWTIPAAPWSCEGTFRTNGQTNFRNGQKSTQASSYVSHI